VTVATGSATVEIYAGEDAALRRVTHVAAINSCTAVTTLMLSTVRLKRLNDTLATKIGAIGQRVELHVRDDSSGVLMSQFIVGFIDSVSESQPFTEITLGPKTSMLQDYSDEVNSDLMYAPRYPLWGVLAEAATIDGVLTNYWNFASQYSDLRMGAAAPSMWKYQTKGSTRQDLMTRLSMQSGQYGLRPIVFFPHRDGERMCITMRGYGDHHDKTATIAPTHDLSKSAGQIVGRMEHAPDSIDDIVNRVTVYYEGGEATSEIPASIAQHGVRESRINAKELTVADDANMLVSGAFNQYPTSIIDLTARYGSIASSSYPGVLNRTYRVKDRRAGAEVDLGEHVVVRYELEMPSFRVRLRLRNRGWSSDDLSGLLAATGRRIDKLERSSLDSMLRQDAADLSIGNLVARAPIWDAKQDALSGDVSGHYHSTDRNLANATGTLPSDRLGIDVLRSTSFELSANSSRLTLSNGMTVLWRESTVTVPNNQTDYNFSMFLGITMYVYHVQLTLQALSPGYAPTVLYNFNPNTTTQQTASLPLSIHRNNNANETTYRVHAMVVGTI
jgi:hypothetical protein